MKGWGEIYEVSWWGISVPQPNGWGSAYIVPANQDSWQYQMSQWKNEINTYAEL